MHPFDTSPLATIQQDLRQSDPTLAYSLERLDDSRLLPWWTRPLVWWLGAPLAIGAFIVTLHLVGPVAFIGLAPLLLLSGLALVATTSPADPGHGERDAPPSSQR